MVKIWPCNTEPLGEVVPMVDRNIKLKKPFTSDQRNYLQDRLTSLLTKFEVIERVARSIKLSLVETLREVSEAPRQAADGKQDGDNKTD